MARILRDDIDRFFQFDVDVPHRTLYIGSQDDSCGEENGVDYLMAERAIKGLHVLDAQAENGAKPITIIMNNPGGDVIHGMAIYDAIRACRNYVTIKVFGYVSSMGSIIMQAGDERLMSEHSQMMIHYGEVTVGGHPKSIEAAAKDLKRDRETTLNIYLDKVREKYPRFPRKRMDDLLNFDTYLTAQEAVDLGLASGIIGETDE